MQAILNDSTDWNDLTTILKSVLLSNLQVINVFHQPFIMMVQSFLGLDLVRKKCFLKWIEFFTKKHFLI